MDSRIMFCIAVLFALSSVLFFSSPSITGRVYDVPAERVVVILKPVLPKNSITGASVLGESIEVHQMAAVKQEVLEDVNSPGLLEGVFGISTTGDVQAERILESLPAMVVVATEEGIEKLQEHPLVEAVHPDIQFSLALADSAPLVNATSVNAVVVNNTALTGQGIAVCVIDTGIQAGHSAFQSRVVAQKCYCSSSCCPNGLSEDALATDTHPASHGTHVSGIIGANGTYVGVAPGVNIVAVKVCSSSCALSDIISGIDFCIAHKDNYNIKVISGSIGDGGNYVSQSSCPTYFDAGINTAYSAGIAGVFASGNNGYTSGISYPACSPKAIAVGASDKNDVMASFTNRGALLEVLAPGVSIMSTKSPGTYGTLSGTSQATPHVSGAVALLMQYGLLTGQNVTPDIAKNALVSTGKNVSGYPRIDILAALEYLGYSAPSEPLSIVILSPVENSTVVSENVLLSANVTGNETPASVIWASNVSGTIGIGENIVVNLTPGMHLITATVMEGSKYASANVSITVTSTPAPDAPLGISIISPLDNATIYANGTELISAVTGNNSDNFTVSWFSNTSGVIGEGSSVFAVLPVGSHAITAVVSEGNDSASANISVNVVYAPVVISVNISSPLSGELLLDNGTTLSASSSPNGSIVWSSNLSGNLGSGPVLTVNLPVGKHLLTAVSSVNGSSGNASVNVTVLSSPCLANVELNGNYNIDVGDMILLLTAYNTNSTACTIPSASGDCLVDLDQNDDSIYNAGDIVALLTKVIKGAVQDVFGSVC
ncbi:MAG: S8 family serine peptidase [Candidatus Woesearchaeota archaeon]